MNMYIHTLPILEFVTLSASSQKPPSFNQYSIHSYKENTINEVNVYISTNLESLKL